MNPSFLCHQDWNSHDNQIRSSQHVNSSYSYWDLLYLKSLEFYLKPLNITVLTPLQKKPCTDRGLTDSQKSEKEKNIGNTIIRRYPSYTDQLMQVGIPDNQKGTTAGDLYDINYDFNYVITCWAQAVIYSNLVIFYNIDYVINYDIDFWPIRHHIRHLSFLLLRLQSTLFMCRRYPMFTEGWFARRFECHATSLRR